MRRYSDELYGIARKLIEDRKAAPQDPDVDPISSLLAVRIDGEPLPDAMILGALRQFLMVGIVAPTTFIGSAVAVPRAHMPSTDRRSMTPAQLFSIAAGRALSARQT